MDSSLRHSVSVSSRISALDVGQLDKINAIPNKTTNDVLHDGLCLEDQLYLETLMNDESSDSDSNFGHAGSPWSPPMAERPMTLNMGAQKRMKMKMKPQYAITLSLEDISYIRPSWGMSKGIKRIDSKRTKKMAAKDKVSAIKIDELEKGAEGSEAQRKRLLVNPYHLLLASLMLLVVSLIVFSYLVDVGRLKSRTEKYRIELYPKERAFNILKQRDGILLRQPSLRVNYGRGIPSDIKHEECTCQMFESERIKYLGGHQFGHVPDEKWAKLRGGEDCFACFNWAQRTNMQMFVDRSYYNNVMNHQHSGMLEDDLAITCYDIKWQSYDTLETPLVDCFEIGDEQWFGLGDIQTPLWPLDKFDQDEFAPLTSNLSADFQDHFLPLGFLPLAQSSSRNPSESINFGSQVDFSLITSNGFSIGNLRSDFQPALKISSSKREICLTVLCTDKCSQLWARPHRFEEFRLRNNLLEYSICSTSNWRLLSLRLIDERTQNLLDRMGNHTSYKRGKQIELRAAKLAAMKQGEVENTRQVSSVPASVHNQQAGRGFQRLDGGTKTSREVIGLIERTLFKTNHIETLDGQTIRQHVDKIVKLNLKTPILVIDTRWQTHVGSFKLNAALFPKAKLLFEILHNKGFKIVLTVKPYVDVSVGIAGLKQLLDSRRIVSAQYESDLQAVAGSAGRARMASVWPQSSHLSSASGNTFKRLEAQFELAGQNLSATMVRRKSFFTFRNETVFFKDQLEQQLAPASRKPYLFDCRESHSGQCVLIDLLPESNRVWLIELIRRSSFLSQEADGILLSGAHPDSQQWDAHFRGAMFELVDELAYRENIFVLPQWTTNFNFVQLAARRRDWDGLRSIVESVLNLGIQGFALIHPGSVWGDMRPTASGRQASNGAGESAPPRRAPISLDGQQSEEQRDEELIMRWLQVAVFLPVLQFDDLAPIERFQIQEHVQNLIHIRKSFVVPELKKNLPFTPLVHGDFADFKANRPANQQQLAALRYSWNKNVPVADHSTGGAGWLANEAIGQQFMIGADLLVAPVLLEGQRQKDIFLPAGIWHDELRNLNIRGGKWLRNYAIELNEVAWFTRAKR